MSDLADLTPSLRFLLLQVRNPDDPMRQHEVEAFARVLECPEQQIDVFDLLSESLTRGRMRNADMLLLGGSGHYSVTDEGDWLERALDSLRLVHAVRKPTFASCWGFQAMARAMGGRVVKDLDRAEVGTHELFLTTAGQSDPVFAPLGEMFLGQMGHEDIVEELPRNATLLASSKSVTNQAYRFDDAPIFCTQFHPELTRDDLLIRVRAYPEYIERIAGLPVDRFTELLQESVESEGILTRFVRQCFGG
jgi:GMP synthase (glutamine-hydrolysing)